MAKRKRFRRLKETTKIKDTEGGNFGNYDEANGGGTPAGEPYQSTSGRKGWDKRKAEGDHMSSSNPHRVDQPRTDDGKFTYNSVNGKELKYAPRGKTVNPLLTGGENGIYIDDAKKQMENKQGSFYEKHHHKDLFQKGDRKVIKEGKKYYVHKSAEDIFEIGRQTFNASKDEFQLETHNWDERKLGRHSEAERTAINAAKSSRKQEYVRNVLGELEHIKKNSGKGSEQGGSKVIKSKKDSETSLERPNMSGDKGGTFVHHTLEQIKKVRNILESSGVDTSGITDEQIDQLSGDFFDFDDDKNQNNQ